MPQDWTELIFSTCSQPLTIAEAVSPGLFFWCVWTHIRSTNYWLSPNTFKIQIGWVCGENCTKMHSESKYFIRVFLSYCFVYVCSLLVVLFMKKGKMKIKLGGGGWGGGNFSPSNLRKLLQLARTSRSLDNIPTWWFRPVFIPDLLVLCDVNLKVTDKICVRLNCLQHCSRVRAWSWNQKHSPVKLSGDIPLFWQGAELWQWELVVRLSNQSRPDTESRLPEDRAYTC